MSNDILIPKTSLLSIRQLRRIDDDTMTMELRLYLSACVVSKYCRDDVACTDSLPSLIRRDARLGIATSLSPITRSSPLDDAPLLPIHPSELDLQCSRF
jgi:hypothetical protein